MDYMPAGFEITINLVDNSVITLDTTTQSVTQTPDGDIVVMEPDMSLEVPGLVIMKSAIITVQFKKN